ncbi:ATPase family AAA domain-containing protein 5 isoform X1 [Centrocercus urophasianus]|uniref:ATPase family AAA domain-containing protein 5 isoform X1 n=3 Tax=Centrocercus urophasianus TaxID=9002 RepID=UPI001C6532A4|nr:ATPase family AAA domain-containing protein 5 isoform X1 [Centrocercus urophasianus]
MVGRLAVAAAAASLPERDGDVQPRKKRREEDVKTITRYFSPLAKAGGKASSPPKANNILDYFKKTSAAEKAPAVAGEITVEFSDDQDCYIAPSKLKRKRKRAHLNNKRREMKELENECVIEINCDDSVGAMRLKEDSDDFIAACALGDQKGGGELAEGNKQGENFSDADIYVKSDKVGPEIDATKNRIRKARKRKNKVNVDLSGSFSFEKQLNEKCRKETKDKKKKVSPEVAECVAVISDSSFEVHTDDKTSQANDSIVTVSFEDFLKSQGENYVEDVEEGTKPMLGSSVTVNEMDQSGTASDPEKCEGSQQLPLRTVTVLAQVHSIPPKSTSLRNEQKGSKKIASIFLKQKVYVEEESSPPLLESEQTEQVTQKRKSNVVIEEEELELAILETAGSDSLKMKSTLEERHQFMKAFRQPTSDVRKSGVKKAPGKAKQVIGKSSKDRKGTEGDSVLNKVLEGGLSEDDVDKRMHSSPENNRSKNKRPKKFQRKGSKRNKALGAKEKCHSSTSEDKESVGNDQMKESNLDVRISSSPKVNELRRSLRQKKTDTSKTITPKKTRMRGTCSENESVWPLQTSTPKASRQYLKKSNVYKAEVITVPSDENSPIRMRFTRISATIKSNKGEAMNNEELNSKNLKISSTSKNISKAKQLVEKAKAIRHNRSKVEDSPAPVRRSSRQQALAERKTLQENEKSVIILHSSQSNDSSTMQDGKQKNLRSLNDVLGKSKNLKVSKNSKGKLGYVPPLLGRNARKSTDEPVVIFDDSSQDASENSQDDDQFRAKREFLMSGLPELLKRQIAKKAAAMEAFFLASSYFKTVVHVQQKDDFCPMWKLKSPLCPALTKLRKLSTEVTNVTKIAISLGEFSTVKSELTGSRSAPVFSGHRPFFSEAFRKGLLEEVVSSNSQFPVRKYFYKFLKKQTERLLLENSMQGSRDASSNSEVNQKPSDNWKETKRKRKEKEDQKSKRRKQTENREIELESRVPRSVIIPVPGGKQADAEQATHLERNKNQKADVRTEDTECLSETNALSGVEDVLWTEKYQPQDSSELVGNKKEIERLHSWLKEWKKRADWEEKRNQKGEKEDKVHEDSLDSLDFKDDKSDIEEENNLCNTVLITGPPGVGKTAAVYACAQELGFKIFEVNASCQRSGRQILSQLKEATQSHQVDKKGINAHKPCFFNSCSSAKSPKKMYSPKKIISPRKPPLSPKGAGLKRNLPPKTLANYFKMPSRCKGNDGTMTAQEKNKGNAQNLCEERNVQNKSISKEVEDGEHNRKSATSLILFEEVDIIFDEDAGFLSAIKTFMATAKRPVILTTNDPTFSLMFDGCFEEINFRTPSLTNAASYLQVLCLAENLRTDVKDLAALLTTNNCDIRQSVLYLQFWVKSGGGYLKDKHLVLRGEGETNPADQAINSGKTAGPKIDFSHDAPPQESPKCDTGCVETLLGLKNILLPSEDLFTFLKQKITTKENWDKLIQLLTEFQLKKVDFIYSNLEFLLPLPVNYLSNQSEASNPIPERAAIVSSKNSSSNSYCYGKSNSGKKSRKTKSKKRLEELDDSDLFDTGLNCSAEFLTLPSDSPPPCAKVNEEESKLMNNRKGKEMKGRAPSNDRRSALVVQCLNSLTEFVEDMSFLDCCVNSPAKEPLEFSKDEGFNWMNGKIKNGLCDEFSIENTDWWSSQSCSEIKAAIEALSFNKCSVSISQNLEAPLSTSNTPGSDQLEGLTLHVSDTRNSVSFNQSADLSIHKKAQKRLAVIRTVFSRAPLNLGNKQASILEYLPTLRSICRSEKLKEQGKTKRRFLHYLEGIHLEIPRQAISSLSLDFP